MCSGISDTGIQWARIGFICGWCLLVPLAAHGEAPSETEGNPLRVRATTVDPPKSEPAPAQHGSPEAATSGPGPASSNSPPLPSGLSLAEQITRLERAMLGDEQRLQKLRDEILAPMSEFRLAEAAFKSVEERLEQKRIEVDTLRDQGANDLLVAAEKAVEELHKSRMLARERFDLAIQTRRTLQEQIAALESKLKRDRQALDRMSGATPAEQEVPVASPKSSDPASPTAAALDAPLASASVAPALGNTPATDNGRANKELIQAQSEAQAKKEEAILAERDAQSITERMAALDRDIALESKLLLAARKKSDIAYQTELAAEGEFEKRSTEGAPPEELLELQQRWREADEMFRRARVEVRERTDHLIEMQSQRAALQQEELTALKAANEKQQAAEVAEQKVLRLKNPFSVHNVMQWSLDHGVQIVGILTMLAFLRWLVSLASHRVVLLMTRRGARGTAQEREDRARTLVGVFHNAASVSIVVTGVMMICEEVGIAVAPLMGGAAVLGLAVAFGAQNLLRDYFYGFVILLENQYSLNDVLRIGEIAGKVEQITLRMTVLRDVEGNVHFIPNGKIDSVTNMTHGWSRAVIDVGIAYKEDADRVMELILELGRELRHDPAFRDVILDEPEMLGVDSLGESAVTIRLLMKTKALSKWPVRREMLRRIKRRFDEVGIEIPFPHRTVYHRYEEASGIQEHPTHKSAEWPPRKTA